MNLDLLIKLVKLANSNPNENEANLAARKACKVIEQGNYRFGQLEEPKVKTYAGRDYDFWEKWKRTWTEAESPFYKAAYKSQEPRNPETEDPWWDTYSPFDMVNLVCTKCNQVEKVSVRTYERLRQTGKPFVCTPCILKKAKEADPVKRMVQVVCWSCNAVVSITESERDSLIMKYRCPNCRNK